MGILEEIRKVQEQQKEITKSFFTDVNTPDLVKNLELDIEKGGKRAQLGETREWDGKKYVKTPKGWRPVKKGDQEAKSAEPEIVPSSAHGDFQYNSKDTALEAGKHLENPHNYSLIQHGGKFMVTTNNRAGKFIKQGAKLIGGFLTGGQFHEATTSKTEVASEKGEEEHKVTAEKVKSIKFMVEKIKRILSDIHSDESGIYLYTDGENSTHYSKPGEYKLAFAERIMKDVVEKK